MEIRIDPAIGDKGKWREGIDRANHILQMVLGKSAERVKGDWVLTVDERQRPVFRLALADFEGSAQATFAPDELENGEDLWFRLQRLWDDLLQDRSHKLLNKLLEKEEAKSA